MTEAKDWLEVLETTEFEPLPGTVNTYQSYRFVDLDISLSLIHI